MERRKSTSYRRGDDKEIEEMKELIHKDHDTLLMISGELAGHQRECAQRYDGLKSALAELKRSQSWAVTALLVGMAGLILRTYFT